MVGQIQQTAVDFLPYGIYIYRALYLLYISQAIEEIRHFRKCLEFPQMPRHLQKMNLMVFKFTRYKFWEMAHHQEKKYI